MQNATPWRLRLTNTTTASEQRGARGRRPSLLLPSQPILPHIATFCSTPCCNVPLQHSGDECKPSGLIDHRYSLIVLIFPHTYAVITHFLASGSAHFAVSLPADDIPMHDIGKHHECTSTSCRPPLGCGVFPIWRRVKGPESLHGLEGRATTQCGDH